MIKLIAGLGNPGPDYEHTRHNAGFWWVDEAARLLKVSLQMERSHFGLVARANVAGQSLWLVEPQTFMNLSGKSVGSLARFYKIAPEEILVVHDELDLPPGESVQARQSVTQYFGAALARTAVQNDRCQHPATPIDWPAFSRPGFHAVRGFRLVQRPGP